MAQSQSRIWYQSFVHPVEQAPYIGRLQALLDSVAGSGQLTGVFVSRHSTYAKAPPDSISEFLALR